MSFFDIIESISFALIPIEKRVEMQSTSRALGLQVAGTGGNLSKSHSVEYNLPRATNINEALDVIRFVASKRKEQTVIVVDELDRIKNQEDKVLIAEFIKNVPTLGDGVKFLFCGIGRNIDEIIGAHPSAGRYLEPVGLEKLNHSDLYDIINDAAVRADIRVPELMLRRIGIVSDRFPHFVHLIGDCMFWAMFDDEEIVDTASPKHYQQALTGALQKTERDLALAYQKATEKSRLKQDYELALWALADKSDTRRQVKEIHETSYQELCRSLRITSKLPRDKLNQRFHNLRNERHGSVVTNHGAGWFSFSENVFRGYVRLVAEQRGVELRVDIV